MVAPKSAAHASPGRWVLAARAVGRGSVWAGRMKWCEKGYETSVRKWHPP